MEFDKLLQTLEGADTEKTASAPEATGPNKALQEALKKTLDKTASDATPNPPASNPIDDLEKLAEEIAGTEKEAELIHAASMGRAFADAALEQFSATEGKLAQMQDMAAPLKPVEPSQQEVDNAVKLAADIGYSDAQNVVMESAFQEKIASGSPEEVDELIKVAHEEGRDDLLVKAAADKGYIETQEKIAGAQYEQGAQEALADVHKLASDEFVKGAQEANVLIQKAHAAQ